MEKYIKSYIFVIKTSHGDLSEIPTIVIKNDISLPYISSRDTFLSIYFGLTFIDINKSKSNLLRR